MQKILSPCFKCMLVYAVVPLIVLITACGGTGGSTGQPTTGATATTLVPGATQPQTVSATSVAFKAGGITFIGPVKSINSNSLVMSAPNGQTFTMEITAQTDLSALGGKLPTVGTTIDMDSAANPDGSFTATALKPFLRGDADPNVIGYTGITTSAVGTDRVIHFTVGVKGYTFTIPTTADLTDFGGNAQTIGNNVPVEVKIQFPSNAVVAVGNPNAR